MVRARAQAAHVLADVGRDDALLEFLFPIALGAGSLRAVAEERSCLRHCAALRGRLRHGEGTESEKKQVAGQRTQSGHEVLLGPGKWTVNSNTGDSLAHSRHADSQGRTDLNVTGY